MNSTTGSQDNNSLAPIGQMTAKIAAVLLGLAGLPLLAGAASFGADCAEFVNQFRERRDKKRVDRALKIAVRIDRRLDELEKKLDVDDPKVDLFVEVVRKALEDDEDLKDEIYVGLLDWIATESPNTAQVRILSDGVKALSYLELYCTLAEGNGQRIQRILQKSKIPEDVYYRRLASFGLDRDGVHVPSSPTAFAEILRRFVLFEQLTSPL